MHLLAASAAALSLTVTTASAQLVDAADVVNNRAIASSPRAQEEFPWLARANAKPVVAARPASNTQAGPIDARENRALAASPRALEQFPELARSGNQLRKFSESAVASMELKNPTYAAASPRMLEQFPWLARGVATQNAERNPSDRDIMNSVSAVRLEAAKADRVKTTAQQYNRECAGCTDAFRTHTITAGQGTVVVPVSIRNSKARK
jgi:hypothetical protein